MNRMKPYIPPAPCVGLLGGSFDPPHKGHLHISLYAIRKFGLDAVWWLVSPGNPLKNTPSLDMSERIRLARNVTSHPRIFVSDLEHRTGLKYSIDTIRFLKRRHSGCRFLWLMGSDNLHGFHHWKGWQEFVSLVNIGVMERVGYRMKARNSVSARYLARYRIEQDHAGCLIDMAPPAWTLVNIPMDSTNSTQLRGDREQTFQPGYSSDSCS